MHRVVTVGRGRNIMRNSQAPLHPVIGGGLGSYEVSPNYHMAFEAFVLV